MTLRLSLSYLRELLLDLFLCLWRPWETQVFGIAALSFGHLSEELELDQ